MTLQDAYTGLLENPDKWDYYDNDGHKHFNEIRLGDFSANSCFRFIEGYLGKGSKDDIDCFNLLKKLSCSRLQHTVSCFLLGLLIFDNCQPLQKAISIKLKQSDPNRENETPEQRFFYIWMLICLYHDVGYLYEDGDESNEHLNEIVINLLKKKPNLVPYSRRTIKRYYDYRHCRWNCEDHGIVGGAKLFIDLCELRADREKHPKDNLYWGTDLENDFLVAAYTISCHNIYKIDKNSEYVSCYKCKKLNNLIQDGRIIELSQHPCLYLLCLADTIEPIKQFKLSPLEKIDIQFDKNSNIIMIDLSMITSKAKMGYRRKIMELKDWLISDVEVKGETITLKLK